MNKVQPQKAQKKLQKKVAKKSARKLSTKKPIKKPVQSKASSSSSSALLSQSKKQISSLQGNNKKNPVLQANFTKALALETQRVSQTPELQSLTGAQRGVKIRSIQVAWAKYWLCKRGLYYEDVWEEQDDVRLALDLMPADIRRDRSRRILRSIDCELKLVWLPEELRQYDPFVSYGLDDAMLKVDLFSAEQANYV